MIQRHDQRHSYLELFRAFADRNVEPGLSAYLGRMHGTKHVFLLQSGRAAIQAALLASMRAGEVIVPGYTCHVVAESVTAAGYTPVFADIGEHCVNMTPETLERSITSRTAAVVITHQFGLPCDIHRMLDICRRHGLLAIEDAAPSFGATVDGTFMGGLGDVGILSFNISKAVSVCTGGALLTNDDDMAARVGRVLGRHSRPGLGSSWRPFIAALRWKVATEPAVYSALRYLRAMAGDDYQWLSPAPASSRQEPSVCPPYAAKLVSARSKDLAWNLARRRRLGEIYSQELGDVPGLWLPQVGPTVQPAWIQYPIFVPDKRGFCHALLKKSVDLIWTFRYCTADSYGAGTCPNSTRAVHTEVGLPVHPSLTDSDAYHVCSLIREQAATQRFRVAVNTFSPA